MYLYLGQAVKTSSIPVCKCVTSACVIHVLQFLTRVICSPVKICPLDQQHTRCECIEIRRKILLRDRAFTSRCCFALPRTPENPINIIIMF